MTSCINRGFFLMPQQEISGANRRAADRLAYAGASARRSPQPGSHTFLVDDSSWHCPKAPWRAAPRCAKMVPPFQMRVSHQLVGFRRDSPIASRPGESRLAERTPAVRPWWRELYKLAPLRPLPAPHNRAQSGVGSWSLCFGVPEDKSEVTYLSQFHLLNATGCAG